MSTLQITSPTELPIQLGSGVRFPIHPLWLRERWQDSKSMDLRTGQRLEDPSDADLQLGLTAVSEVEPGRYRIRFTDGLEADFLAREILAEASLPVGAHDCPPLRLWDGSLPQIPRLAWSSTPTDEQRIAWLQPFLELGFVIFTGVPTESKQVLKVGGTFGYVREANFGAYFDVRSVPDANDLAYTSLLLDP